MGLFTPKDCSVGYSTQNWLLVGIAGLLIVIVASLAEFSVQWRRARRTDASGWVWLPLVPTLLWSLICALLAFEAIIWYRDEAAYLSAPPAPIGEPISSPYGICSAIAQAGVEIQVALGVGIMLLIVGAEGLLLTKRRTRAT